MIFPVKHDDLVYLFTTCIFDTPVWDNFSQGNAYSYSWSWWRWEDHNLIQTTSWRGLVVTFETLSNIVSSGTFRWWLPSPPLGLMWRQWLTKTSSSKYGTSEDRLVYDLTGGATIPTPMQWYTWWTVQTGDKGNCTWLDLYFWRLYCLSRFWLPMDDWIIILIIMGDCTWLDLCFWSYCR